MDYLLCFVWPSLLIDLFFPYQKQLAEQRIKYSLQEKIAYDKSKDKQKQGEYKKS